MSNSSSSSTSGSIGTSGLLGVLFVGLRLTGFIDWPWVWVLSPFWIPLAIALALLAIAGLILVINAILEK